MRAIREYIGLTTTGHTVSASACADPAGHWRVLFGGPDACEAVCVLGELAFRVGSTRFASEADAVASIESGRPEVVWVGQRIGGVA